MRTASRYAKRPGAVRYSDTTPQAPFGGGELLHEVGLQQAGFSEAAAAAVQPYHRVAFRPVPAVVEVEPFEQLLDRVQEQALAKAAGARQEVVLNGLQNDVATASMDHVVAESTRQNCSERAAVSCQHKQLIAYQMQSHGPGAWAVEEVCSHGFPYVVSQFRPGGVPAVIRPAHARREKQVNCALNPSGARRSGPDRRRPE